MVRTDEWMKVKGILQDAFETPPELRAAFIHQACAGDLALQRQVFEMLEIETGGFLDHSLQIADDDALAEIPATIGPYRVDGVLGRGGMGIVYAATRDDDFHKKVAIKVLPWELSSLEMKARFQSERQILAELNHHHIAALLDGGTTANGMPYLVMELIEGQPLLDYCDAHRLSIEQRLRLLAKICRTVHFVHQNLIIHRDLKPSNILVTADGTPKLLDFGIAKLLQQDAHSSATLTLALTPRYASPEQLKGQTVTTASDVYTLGLICHELICGLLPKGNISKMARTNESEALLTAGKNLRPSEFFSNKTANQRNPIGKDAEQELDAICRLRQCDPTRMKRKLRGDLDNILLMALREEPSRRYASALQLAEDFERFLTNHPVSACKEEFSYLLRKFLRRHWRATFVAAVFLGMIFFFLSMLILMNRRILLEYESAQEMALFLEKVFEASNPYESRDKLQERELSARSLLDRAVAKLDANTEMEPRLKIRLIQAMANSYYHLHQYPRGEQLARQNLLLCQQHLPSHAHETIQARFLLGMFIAVRGDFEAASPFLESAFFDLSKKQQLDDTQITQLAFLAWVDYERGNYHQLLARYEQLKTQVDQAKLEGRIELLNMVALARQKVEQVEQAELIFQQTLALTERELGVKHPLWARLADNLGALYRADNRLDQAEALFHQALERKRELYGDEDPDTAFSLYNLGMLYKRQAQFEKSEQFLLQALRAAQASLGSQHSRVGDYLNSLSNLYFDMDRLQECEEARIAALSIRMVRLGPDAQKVGESLFNLGNLSRKQGHHSSAIDFYLDAQQIFRRSLGANHSHIPLCDLLIGQAYADAGALPEAEHYLRLAISQLKSGSGKPSAGELAEAEQALEQLLCRKSASAST